MNSTQIRYFIHLSHTLNVSETARQLYVAQPAVSKQIAALEQEIGFPLFIRSNRGMKLTDAGVRLYEFFSSVEEEYVELKADIEKAMTPEKQTLNIGILENMVWGEIKEAVKDLKKLYPELTVNLSWHNNETLFKNMANGNLDAVIAFEHSIENRKGIFYKELMLEQAILIIDREHPLATKDKIQCSDLSGEIFCLPPSGDGIYEEGYTPHLLNLLKIKPGGYLPVDNMASGFAAVEMEKAVAIIDDRTDVSHPERFRFIETNTYQSLVIAYLKQNHSIYLQQFITLLCTEFSKHEYGYR